MSLGGNYYALVIVDDFSRFTWNLFLESKSDAFSAFKKLARRLQNTKNNNIGSIMCLNYSFNNIYFDF